MKPVAAIGETAVTSPWLAASEWRPRPALDHDLECDVVVLGGGIVGVSTAFELVRTGMRVGLLEARTVASGVTGNSTAKLSALHGLVYQDLVRKHGVETAWAYAALSQAGVAAVARIAGELGIECGLERRDAYTYTERDEHVAEVEAEVEAARRAGLAAELTDTTDLPFGIRAAVRLPDQAQFDPVAWVRGVAEAFEAAGGVLHERTRALSVSQGRPYRVRTDGGATVVAGHVVAATQMPVLDRGLQFARLRPERSYAVAAPAGATAPRGMYLSVETPTRSIRSLATPAGEHVIVGGEGHKTGQDDPGERYARLEADARARFGTGAVSHRWAAHDLVSADRLPLIGPLAPWAEGVLCACGFGKWGLGAGVAAAGALRDHVLGRPDEAAATFDPRRLRLRAALPSLLRENADNGVRLVLDRALRRGSAEGIAPGEGRVVSSGLGQHAVFRDDDGTLYRLSARCTHLGCIVAWNGAERTWDCPCHGSRFAATGEPVQGPATRPLESRG